MRYRIEAAKDKYDFTEDDQRILFLREAAGIIALLDSEVEQDVYTTSTAKLAGVTPEAFRQEVKQAKVRLRSQAKRTMHREVRTPAQAVQPKDRTMHFDNVRSARAEEGVLSLLFSDTSLMEQMRQVLTPDDFSSPELGKIYGLCSALYNSGRTIAVPALEGKLEPREMDLLASALRIEIPIDRRQQALEDYTQIIQEQKLMRETQIDTQEDPLLKKAQMQRKNKGFAG